MRFLLLLFTLFLPSLIAQDRPLPRRPAGGDGPPWLERRIEMREALRERMQQRMRERLRERVAERRDAGDRQGDRPVQRLRGEAQRHRRPGQRPEGARGDRGRGPRGGFGGERLRERLRERIHERLSERRAARGQRSEDRPRRLLRDV